MRRPGERTRGWVVGRAAGAPVVVSPGWVLVVVALTWFLTPAVQARTDLAGAGALLVAGVFVLLVMLSVFLHELGHALVARRQGVEVHELAVTLLGGHTQLGSAATSPARSAAVALAGPAVNLALATVVWLASLAAPGGGVVWLVLVAAALANLVVGAFNLLPALPLDGGRVLEAVVWAATGRRWSGTVVAAWGGRLLAVALAAWAVMPLLAGRPPDLLRVVWVALAGAFLWSGAGDSLRAARSDRAVHGTSVAALMRPAVVARTDGHVGDLAATADGVDVVLVASDGRPVAVVDRAAVLGVPEALRPVTPLQAVAVPVPEGAVVSRGLSGRDAVDAVARVARTAGTLAVVEDGRVVGVLRSADVVRHLRSR